MSINVIGLILVGLLLVFIVALPPLLIWGLIRRIRSKRFVPAGILGGLTLVVLGTYGYCGYFILPLGDQLVVQHRYPDGWEMAVHQHCNYSAEPYYTHFYFRKDSQPWAAFYMDHEDDRWWSGRIEYQSGAPATIYRDGKPIAVFSTSNLTFTIRGHTSTNWGFLPKALRPGEEMKLEHN